MPTAVPPIAWTPTGIVVPTQAAILAGVFADLQTAFGGNLTTGLNTPQGQMASSLAAIIFNAYSAIAYFVNNVNPNAAQDFMQDAIADLYFLTRNPGTPTAVQCVCTGVVNTMIPTGAQATDTSGNLYVCTQGGNIGSGGTVTLTFENVVNGPTPCPSNTLNKIYQAIPGWDSINNPNPGVPGTNVESQAAFAARMKASVAINAQGSLPSLYAALAALPGVTSVYVIENDTSSTVDTGPTNYPVVANSIYAAVVGGVAQDIANTIWTKKSPGCNTNGNTTETVTDTSYPSGSQPTYTIKYNVPTSIPMTVHVVLATLVGLPSNIDNLIQTAVLSQFQNGSASVPAVGIANTILAASYFAPVLATYNGLPLLQILLGTAFSATATLNSTATINVTAVASGYIAPGDIVTGTGIPTGAYILPFGTSSTTGTGGTGTYEISASATSSASGVAISSTSGNLTSFQAGIDQIPTLAATNITVTN